MLTKETAVNLSRVPHSETIARTRRVVADTIKDAAERGESFTKVILKNHHMTVINAIVEELSLDNYNAYADENEGEVVITILWADYYCNEV